MELHFPSMFILFAFLLFLFMALKRSSKSKNSIKLPPGPQPLPIIGNMHQLVGSSLIYQTLRDLANKYGPLMYLRLGEVPTVIVSSPEIAKNLLKTHDIIFAQRPHLLVARILNYDSSGIAFSRYGDYWRQVRKICTMELLSAKRVQNYRSIREEEVMNLVKAISLNDEGIPVNLSKKFSSLTYGITARAAFGKKSKHQEEFISVVEEALELLAGFTMADVYPSVKLFQVITPLRFTLERLYKKLDKILGIILNEHKERDARRLSGREEKEVDQEDLVDVLLRIRRQGDLEFPLTDNNIKAVISDMFTAGSETSSTVVEWAMSEIVKNPQVMKRVQTEVREVFDKRGNVDETCIHELKYLQLVIKETMRLHTSLPLLLPRESSEDCEINGYVIPAKTRILVNAWAITRDPEYWPEAEVFNPDRFIDKTVDFKGTDFEFIPFGAGRRICPGISFAMANIQLPLAQLLYHFDWKLPNGLKHEELDMTEDFGLTVKRKQDLCLIPTPYHPSPVEY